MQTNPAVEQSKIIRWSQSPWNQSGRKQKGLRRKIVGSRRPHTNTQHLYVCSTNAITVLIRILTSWHFCYQMYQKMPKITDRTKFRKI